MKINLIAGSASQGLRVDIAVRLGQRELAFDSFLARFASNV